MISLLAALTSLPAVAHPQIAEAPGRVNLVWQAPAGCPDQAQFERRVTEHLGHPFDGDKPASTVARAVVARTADQAFRVELSLEQEGETRVRALTASECTEALDAAALIVALAIDPSIAGRLPDAPVEPDRSVPAQPIEAPCPRTVVPEPVPPPQVGPRAALGFSTTLALRWLRNRVRSRAVMRGRYLRL